MNINPYRSDILVRNMLADPSRFIGLRDELEQLLGEISDHRPAAVSLVGPRGLGKSFMLHFLMHPDGAQRIFHTALGEDFAAEPQRLVFVLLDLEEEGFSTPNHPPLLDLMYQRLLERLATVLEIEDMRLIPLQELPTDYPATLSQLRRTIQKAIAQARQEADDEELREAFEQQIGTQQPQALIKLLRWLDTWQLRAVFLIDELDEVIPQLSRDDFDYLRAILPLASMVVATSRALSDLVKTDIQSSPFFNLLQRLTLLNLHLLSPEEAMRLITEPPTWTDPPSSFQFSPSDVQAILEMTGRHPDLILVSCEQLYAWLRRSKPVHGNLLNPVELPYYRARLGAQFTDMFAELWHRLSRHEREALTALAAGETLPPSDIPPSLLQRGYVVYAQGSYQPFAGLFTDYIRSLRRESPVHSEPSATTSGLTDLEQRLYDLLARQRGTVVTRDQIIATLYDPATDPQEARGKLDALVFRLRPKLSGEKIESVRGQGYRLVRS